MNIIPAGLKRGLEMIGACLSKLHRAEATGNAECADACWDVVRVWFGEAFTLGLGAKRITLRSFGLAVLLGADPFAESRAAWREVESQFPNV